MKDGLDARSCSRIPGRFAHGLVAPSSVELKARTADVKPAVLWPDGNISAVSALFMLAKFTFLSFVRMVAHKNRLTVARAGFLRGDDTARRGFTTGNRSSNTGLLSEVT